MSKAAQRAALLSASKLSDDTLSLILSNSGNFTDVCKALSSWTTADRTFRYSLDIWKQVATKLSLPNRDPAIPWNTWVLFWCKTFSSKEHTLSTLCNELEKSNVDILDYMCEKRPDLIHSLTISEQITLVQAAIRGDSTSLQWLDNKIQFERRDIPQNKKLTLYDVISSNRFAIRHAPFFANVDLGNLSVALKQSLKVNDFEMVKYLYTLFEQKYEEYETEYDKKYYGYDKYRPWKFILEQSGNTVPDIYGWVLSICKRPLSEVFEMLRIALRLKKRDLVALFMSEHMNVPENILYTFLMLHYMHGRGTDGHTWQLNELANYWPFIPELVLRISADRFSEREMRWAVERGARNFNDGLSRLGQITGKYPRKVLQFLVDAANAHDVDLRPTVFVKTWCVERNFENIDWEMFNILKSTFWDGVFWESLCKCSIEAAWDLYSSIGLTMYDPDMAYKAGEMFEENEEWFEYIDSDESDSDSDYTTDSMYIKGSSGAYYVLQTIDQKHNSTLRTEFARGVAKRIGNGPKETMRKDAKILRKLKGW